MTPRPSIEVAVVMRRIRQASAWQPWRWELGEVIPNEPAFGSQPRCLVNNASEERWLHAGFTVELFRDDAEGYYLNATTPAPCWFVLWRMEETPSISEAPIARPVAVSLSYHDAGRWLDAQETVEQVSAPADVIEWMRAFADEHYVPEPRKRRRPQSFRALEDRFAGEPEHGRPDE
ncbi:MAG TPA: DUF3305 domain-containing protein [Ramlibacter sp.]|uniref:DUF3305 domain-containing protein n=1 Tax=Ramlibacter sp. TaxID=1917967 RepID=UPI002B928454|nr:DUF3305 domain-containing protein [Ramlibacter sp.]HVZ45449.1 DUF3305 domain-containing protein [Ramlibacter sp.]